MDRKLLDSFAELLRKQRKEYLDEFRRAEEDLESIAEERESELEEHAQEEQSARLLTRMDDRTLHAVQEIDAALQRLLKGTYGSCQACGSHIPIARLRTLPATRYCTDCEAQHEKQTPISPEEAETPQGAGSRRFEPTEDTELAQVIREHLKEDGRIDTEASNCLPRGVVHLLELFPVSRSIKFCFRL
jgi:RNA polymerase-binding protein DksA